MSPNHNIHAAQKALQEGLERELRRMRAAIGVFGELVEAQQTAEARLYELLRREQCENEELRKDLADARSQLLTREIDAEFQVNQVEEAIHGPNAVA